MQKGSAGVIILIIALILAGLAGAYYLGVRKGSDSDFDKKLSQQNPMLQSESSIQPVNKPSPDTLPVDINTLNWITYTMDNPNGFSFQYPPTWSVEKGNGTLTINSNEKFPQVENDTEPIMYWVNVNVYANPLKKAFKDFVTTDLPDGLKQIFTYKTEIINGYTAYRTITLPSRAGCDFVYIERQDKSFAAFNFCYYDENKPFINQEKFHNIFNQILATFKFTN